MIIIEGSITSNGRTSYEGYLVRISSADTNMSYVTAQSGRFYFEGNPGTYTISVSKRGYLKYTIVGFKAEDNIDYNINDIPMYPGDSQENGKITNSSLAYIQINIGQVLRTNYWMDYDGDGEITLNDVEVARKNITKTSQTVTQSDIEYSETEIISDDTEFRKAIFDYLKLTVPEVLTQGDLEVWYKLVGFIYGDLYERALKLPDEINIDRCSATNLRALSSITGYPWSHNLTIDNQRQTIKLYLLIRRYRGSVFSIVNLIRVFGSSILNYYSSADLRGVYVKEYDPYKPGPPLTGWQLFPGDLNIFLPELSTVLTDFIEEARPAGRRLKYTLYIFIGMIKMYITATLGMKQTTYMYPNPINSWDISINRWMDYPIDSTEKYDTEQLINKYEDQLSHEVTSNTLLVSMNMANRPFEGWTKGFIFNIPQMPNYKGYMWDDPDVQDEHVAYN